MSKSQKPLKQKKSALSNGLVLPKGEGECREFYDILTEFIESESVTHRSLSEGVLTESHLIKIRNHLSTCLHCTRVYQDVRVLIQLCQTESIIEPTNVSSQLWRVLDKRFKTKKS